MGPEKRFSTLSRSGEACGAEQRGKRVERSASEDDSLGYLILQIPRGSL